MNARTFLARDFHAKAGMHCLIESFYRSITEGTPVPIPYREILLTATILDRIFDQIRATRSHKQFTLGTIHTSPPMFQGESV